MSVVVSYPDHLDLVTWSARHERGEAPGLVPYGLDKLSLSDIDVTYESVRSAGRDPRRWIGALAPTRWRRKPARFDCEKTAFAWDEKAAVGMFARHASSGHQLITGVIWATDMLERGESSARVHALRHILRQFDVVFVLSTGQIPILLEWLRIPEERVKFVPFGIDVPFFPFRPLPSAPMVLSLGNDRDRDIATLFACLEIVHNRRPDVRLVVQTRSTLVAPCGVETVRALSSKELHEHYANASLVALATKPNLHISGLTTALEAMAVGRGVVMTETPGTADYVLDRVTGRLTPPDDPARLAAAILESLDDVALLESYGAAAASHVRARHTEVSMCRALAEIIRSEVVA